MNTIVLKDALAADITFSLISRTPEGVVYERKGTHLLGRSRVTLSLNENSKTNRVRGKLTVPTIADCSATCGEVPEIKYSEVASFDFSVYRAGQETGRKDIAAMFASLLSSKMVKDAIVDGSMPATL